METFYGFVESPHDALLLFEAVRLGILPSVPTRLSAAEKSMIRSGSVFVYYEEECGIKRWTDGRLWGPSRFLGKFLIYKELDADMVETESLDVAATTHRKMVKVDGKNAVRGRSGTHLILEDGLVKKAISADIGSKRYHLVSYFNGVDVFSKILDCPSSLVELCVLNPNMEIKLIDIKGKSKDPSSDDDLIDLEDHLPRRHSYAAPPSSPLLSNGTLSKLSKKRSMPQLEPLELDPTLFEEPLFEATPRFHLPQLENLVTLFPSSYYIPN